MAKNVAQNRAMELILEECEACFKSRLRKDLEASCLLGNDKTIRINDELQCTLRETRAILCQHCPFRAPNAFLNDVLKNLKKLEEVN